MLLIKSMAKPFPRQWFSDLGVLSRYLRCVEVQAFTDDTVVGSLSATMLLCRELLESEAGSSALGSLLSIRKEFSRLCAAIYGCTPLELDFIEVREAGGYRESMKEALGSFNCRPWAEDCSAMDMLLLEGCTVLEGQDRATIAMSLMSGLTSYLKDVDLFVASHGFSNEFGDSLNQFGFKQLGVRGYSICPSTVWKAAG